MKLENQNILIVSNEPWGIMWFSKHNYAYELSKKNKVFFVNPPGKWKIKNFFCNKVLTDNYSENLKIINYKNYLPFTGPSNMVFSLNNILVSKLIRSYLTRNKVDKVIVWTFDPYRLINPKLLNCKISIYHSVDNFRTKREGLLANNVDYIITVSNEIAKNFQHLKKPLKIIPHGISSETLKISEKEKSKFDLTQKNYALYIGVIDKRIDFNLLEKCIIAFPNLEFVFIGTQNIDHNNQTANKLFIKKEYNNLFSVGSREYKDLKIYIKKAKICLMFLNKEHKGNLINHHKILQYLAQGKPVFCTEISDYLQHKELLYMSNEDHKIIEMIKDFIKNGEHHELKEKRIKFTQKHIYENLFSQIEKFINNHAHHISNSK